MTHSKSGATIRRVAAVLVVATLLQAGIGVAFARPVGSPTDAEFYKLSVEPEGHSRPDADVLDQVPRQPRTRPTATGESWSLWSTRK